MSVHVLSASGLKACDLNGLSDPYCVVTTRPESKPKKAKTIVKKKTLNPVWSEVFVFEVDGAESLSFVVKDWDFAGRNELCGTAEVDLSELALRNEEKRTLCLPLTDKGELRVALEFQDRSCLFGLDVQTVCFNEKTDVPIIVTKCIQAVESHGLDRGGMRVM